MADRKSWLEMVLKRKTFNDSPIKVIAIEDASGVVGKGENYLSEIERVKGTVLLGSGKTKKVSLIIKNQHETEQMKKLSLELGVFFREITMYRDILPKMEDLLDEINDPEGIMWGRCYDYRLYDQLVFEDLSESGYRMADRKKQLGLQSALLVVKNLAKFHALTRILLDRGEIPMDIFGKHVWSRNTEMTVKMVTDSAERLIKFMKTWGDEWQEAAERLQNALPVLGKRLVEELEAKPEEFSVLCHGDCWTNNMLFKGDDIENPTSVKFLDLQVCFVGSPVRELYYFLLSSVRLEVHKQHNDQILQAYVDSLKHHLLRFQYEGNIPDLDSIKELFRKKLIFSLENAFGIIPIATGETQDIPDMEEIAKAYAEAMEKGGKMPEGVWDLNSYLSVTGMNKVKDIVKNAMECGLI
uniref:CHK kinase-like domain-containing protein n=1 Tax=Lygus hesperus TaxID=30085 RepID=A0A0K8SPR6_LYGHE